MFVTYLTIEKYYIIFNNQAVYKIRKKQKNKLSTDFKNRVNSGVCKRVEKVLIKIYEAY